MKAQVAVVTTTFSQNEDDLRFRLARMTMKAVYRNLGVRPIVIDASPTGPKEVLRRDGAQVFDQVLNTTMGSARRQAVEVALRQKAEIIIWMEPEKAPLTPFLSELVDQFTASEANLLIPRRRTLRSYPAYQMAKELEGNHEAGSVTGRPDLDLWFGPRVMDRRAAELFCSYNGAYGDRWESIFIPVMSSLRQGLKVIGHMVDYIHPPEQTASESGPDMDQKRDDQLNSLLAAMGQYWLDSTPVLTR